MKLFFSDEGKVTYNLTVPDTITSWALSAFAISEKSGLSVADTTTVCTFNKDFIIFIFYFFLGHCF